MLCIASPGVEDVVYEGIVSERSVPLLTSVTARRLVLLGVIAVMVTTGDVREVSDAVGFAGNETYFCGYHRRPYTHPSADVSREPEIHRLHMEEVHRDCHSPSMGWVSWRGFVNGRCDRDGRLSRLAAVVLLD